MSQTKSGPRAEQLVSEADHILFSRLVTNEKAVQS